MEAKPKLTENDGYEALREHVLERALAARAAHGPDFDRAAIEGLLADPKVMRFPTRLSFAADGLLDGEFAWARSLGPQPQDGYEIVVHPQFENRSEALPALVAYHIVSVNYLDVATSAEAELYGAALLGLEIDDYYKTVCAFADELPGAEMAAAQAASVAAYEAAEASEAGGSSSCSSHSHGPPASAEKAPGGGGGCGPSCGCG